MLALFHSFNKLCLQVLSPCLESLAINGTSKPQFEIKRNNFIEMISITGWICGLKLMSKKSFLCVMG